jgi:hypothetical protein
VVCGAQEGGAEEGEEEEEEMPEDLADLAPDVQQFRIKMRSLYMMALGTAMVLVFSDPMVEVIAEVGVRTNIPSFYVAFILSPFVSPSEPRNRAPELAGLNPFLPPLADAWARCPTRRS